MDPESKEVAKELLGFAQVPFYVVLNEEGRIVAKGGKKRIDFEGLPELLGVVPPLVMIEEVEEIVVPEQKKVKVDRVFDMDDDF